MEATPRNLYATLGNVALSAIRAGRSECWSPTVPWPGRSDLGSASVCT
ncbi:MAG: hypothetical protein Ct9H300mP12_06010 [Acidimicrobiales bacterium]|nr:MAG: hypothetical protein Ct9H300mP12_06010 [Acidimicrobiales bacterium]